MTRAAAVRLPEGRDDPSEGHSRTLKPAQPARELDPGGIGEHLDRLYRAALAMCGGREEADDLVQETYAGVLSRPRLVRGETDLAYMLGALRKTFLVKLRTERRRPRSWPAGDELELATSRLAHSDEMTHDAHDVLAAITSLPAEFRDAIVAVDLAGLSYREAARVLRVRQGTVRSRLFRARQGVAQRLAC